MSRAPETRERNRNKHQNKTQKGKKHVKHRKQAAKRTGSPHPPRGSREAGGGQAGRPGGLRGSLYPADVQGIRVEALQCFHGLFGDQAEACRTQPARCGGVSRNQPGPPANSRLAREPQEQVAGSLKGPQGPGLSEPGAGATSTGLTRMVLARREACVGRRRRKGS